MPPLSSSNSSSGYLSPDSSCEMPMPPKLVRQRSESLVKNIRFQYEKMMKKSSFLRKRPNRDSYQSVGFFERSEIKTGRLLGSGAFSQVYEITGFELDNHFSDELGPRKQQLREQMEASAVDPVTGKCRYVIKHLRRGGWSHWEDFAAAATDLLGEASFLVRLDHPSIIKVRGLPTKSWSAYANGSHDGFFIVMDRLAGSLEDRIDGWRHRAKKTNKEDRDCCHSTEDINNDDISRKLEYSVQIVSALDYLHKKRLVFRDLKPANVGFSAVDTEQLLLFDFGFCRELPSSICENSCVEVYPMSCVGTKRYAAPEIFRHSVYNEKVDVYAWALLTWEMFTLALPYSAYDVKQFVKHVVVGQERPPLTSSSERQQRHETPLGQVPECLHSILADAWHPSVSRRSNAALIECSIEELIPEQPAIQSRTQLV